MTFKQSKTSMGRIDSQNTNLYQEGNRSMLLLMKKKRDLTKTLITCLSHAFSTKGRKLFPYKSTLKMFCLFFPKPSSASARCLFKVFSVSYFPSKFRPFGVSLKTFQNLILSHTSKLILPLCLFTHSNCNQTVSFVFPR